MKTIINPIVENLLNYDPIEQIEKEMKKNFDSLTTNEKDNALKHCFSTNYSKREFLKSLNDTHMSMNWEECLSLIKEHGFVEGLSYSFDYTEPYGENRTRKEQAILYYHPTKGLVIWATSYTIKNKRILNDGKLYGEIRYLGSIPKQKVFNRISKETVETLVLTDEIKEAMQALSRCSHNSFHYLEEGIWFSYDVREGLINKISLIEKYFEFLPVWKNPQFLWFLDYQEEKQKDYDYKKINLEKIKQASPELQKILQVYIDSLNVTKQ